MGFARLRRYLRGLQSAALYTTHGQSTPLDRHCRSTTGNAARNGALPNYVESWPRKLLFVKQGLPRSGLTLQLVSSMILQGFSGRDVEPSGLRPALFLAIGSTGAAPDTRPFTKPFIKSALESKGKLQSNLNGPG